MLRAWLPAAAYAALIFYLSSKPGLSPTVEIDHADKVAHFLEYGMFGLLLFRAAWIQWGRRAGVRVLAFPLIAGALLAAADEIFQGTVGRTRSAADWSADVAGLLVAVLIGVRWTHRRRIQAGSGTRESLPAHAAAGTEDGER